MIGEAAEEGTLALPGNYPVTVENWRLAHNIGLRALAVALHKLVLAPILGILAAEILQSLVWLLLRITTHHLPVRILMIVTERHDHLAKVEDLVKLVLSALIAHAVLSSSLQEAICNDLLGQVLLLRNRHLLP